MKLKNLETKFLGKRIFYYKEIDSTQNEIWRQVDAQIQNGDLVIADIQTAGKGTHGRTWYTEKSDNIAFSFYIETNCEISRLEGLTIEIANILVYIFNKLYNIDLDIKYPNDLICNGKKVGGILTEGKIYKGISRFLVIGIGINTSQTIFNKEIQEIATSIKNEFEIEVNREDVITEFCKLFEIEIMSRL